jgi:hypothetical protein
LGPAGSFIVAVFFGFAAAYNDPYKRIGSRLRGRQVVDVVAGEIRPQQSARVFPDCAVAGEDGVS